MSLLPKLTLAQAISLKKGDIAPFDGGMLDKSLLEEFLSNREFRFNVEPLLKLPLEENPRNLECAGMGVILGVSAGLAAGSDIRSNQVLLLSSSGLAAIYILLTCL